MSLPYFITDVETTGLDRQKSLIMEIAALAVNEQLEEIGCINYVIDPRSIEPLSDQNIEAEAMNLHANNGLLHDISQGNCVAIDVARGGLIRWAGQMGMDLEVARGQWTTKMVGSNPWFDRDFIRRFFPEISTALHYRMLCVTSLRECAAKAMGMSQDYLRACIWPVKPGQGTHRALTDCRNTLAEFRAYSRMMLAGTDSLRAIIGGP